jgi:DNA adenine methylase
MLTYTQKAISSYPISMNTATAVFPRVTVLEEIDQNYYSPIPTKPFLKWVGGKSQLLKELKKYFPTNFNKYIEPFLGGGAVFFNLIPETAIINDSNEELMNTYSVVKNNVEDLIDILSQYEHSEDFFYKLRKTQPKELSMLERAARTIYMNKTCFNGLYRVNKKGEFNVPFGKYTNPTICNTEILKSASLVLQNTAIECADYQTVLKKYAQKGDFIYIDPPYHPISKYSDFKRYTKEFFYEKDQIKLRDTIKELKDKGCTVITSNSYCEFILDLYKDFEIKIVEAKRCINKDATKRNEIKEIIIL